MMQTTWSTMTPSAATMGSRGGGLSAAMGRREGRAFCGSQETQRKTRQSARREMKRKKRKRASRAGVAEGASGGGVEAK